MDKNKAKDIVRKNLSDARLGVSKRAIVRDAHVRELAHPIVSETLDEDSAYEFELACDGIRSRYNEFISKSGANADGMADTEMRVKFCSFAAEFLAEREIYPAEPVSFEELFDGDIRIACFSSRASDNAYKAFAKLLPRTEQVMCDSTAALCEEVADGRCELGMLPIYSSADGFMQSVYRHTVRNELSPVMSVNLRSDEDIYVRYLLFSATPCVRKNAHTMVLTVASSDGDVSMLPAALKEYGAILEDVTSPLPLLYEGEHAFRFTFSVENADLMRIRLFLQINFPRFLINGIYEKTETEFF